MTEEISSSTQKKREQPEKMFILIGVLWLLLGGFIIYQLPDARSNFITIEWATETETDTAGFNIYRAPSGGADCADIDETRYVQVNNQLIKSDGDATSGSQYDYEDFDVERGVDYCYQLEDIELNSTRTRHDPISGDRLRQIDRILYMILAPVSLIVGVWLIASGIRKGSS